MGSAVTVIMSHSPGAGYPKTRTTHSRRGPSAGAAAPRKQKKDSHADYRETQQAGHVTDTVNDADLTTDVSRIVNDAGPYVAEEYRECGDTKSYLLERRGRSLDARLL
jgi:hypothetical protein